MEDEMRNGKRWVPAVVVAAGMVLGGVAVAQKQPAPPPGAGGKGGPPAVPQSQKLHLTPPNIAPPRQARPAPPPPAPRPPQPTQGPQPSQKLHLTPPNIAPQPGGPRPGSRPPNEREAQRQTPAAPAPAPAPDWPALPPRMAQEPAALATLRALLSDEVQLGYREARQQGEVLTLVDADIRRGRERFEIEELILDTPSAEGLRRGEARNIRIALPDGRTTIAQLDIEGLAMLALRPGQAPSDRDPDQVTLERLRFVGLEVQVDDVRVDMARFDLSGWRLGQAGRLGMERLDVRLNGMPVDRIRVASAGLEGLDIAAMMAAATRDEAPPAPPAGRQVYRVEGVELQRDGQGLGGMGRLLVEGETRADGYAGGRIALNDVVVERTPETAVVLDAVGLERLSMELTIDASWTPVNDRLELSALAFGVRDLGALALGWTVEGVNPNNPSPDPATVRLFSAQLRYADQSLYERTLADQGRRQNMTPAQVREQHREMVTGVLTPPRPDPRMDSIREALLRFVAGDAREVEITARPPAPVSLAQAQEAMMRGPGEGLALLGVSAVAR
jgi:hypothetical protein